MGSAKRKKREDDASQETYVSLAYENLHTFVYGRSGAIVRAGFTPLPLFKKSLIKLLLTLARAAERNINGDEKHREKVSSRFSEAADQVKSAKTKDEAVLAALTAAIGANFELMGRLPRNWRKAKADWRSAVDLSAYRTLGYVRTDRQRIQQILDYCYNQPQPNEGPGLFEEIIDIRNKHPHDDARVLSWIRDNKPTLFSQFNAI